MKSGFFRCSLSLLAVAVVGCASSARLMVENKQEGQGILFFADPQIHNIYGRGVKQMTVGADLVSKVAIRAPELNILAPIVLESLLEESINQNDLAALVVLGDVTNIACSGEFDTFLNSVTSHRPPGTPLLLAHGNHDTYLMGTVNSYIPAGCPNNWRPKKMGISDMPTDESWWGNRDISSQRQQNWRDSCYQPSVKGKEPSSPMNKSRWLARYMELLKEDGMLSSSTALTDCPDEKVFSLELSSAPDSALGKFQFTGKGLWYPPSFGDKPSMSNFTRSYLSFIVQRVEFDESTLILIDTSVCENAYGGKVFLTTNAGLNACIGSDQFDIIRELVDSANKTKKLVLAGHFPIDDLAKNEKKRLIEIASTHRNWVYMSAHTHDSLSDHDWKTGTEINIGSTTDWPMEVNIVWFNRMEKRAKVRTYNAVPESPIAYKRATVDQGSEVCRHLPVAEKLAKLDPLNLPTKWEMQSKGSSQTSECRVSDSRSWKESGQALREAIAHIRERLKNDDGSYRKALLKVAASASKADSKQWHFGWLIS